MVAPAALSLGSCSGLVSSQADRVCLPKRSPHLPPPDSFGRRRPGPAQLVFNKQSLCLPSSTAIKAVALDKDQLGSSEPSEEDKPKKYYFLVANAKFMLDEEEHFKEQMYERLRHFGERNRKQDFWLVIEPKFLDKFPNITKRLKRPAVALVSTDGPWITFMKLRLDRVLTENFETDNLEEALASKPVDLHFEKPEKWVAPYPKYEFGWWEPFLPPKA